MDYYPGNKTLFFSVFLALLSTKKGRNLVAKSVHKHIIHTVMFWIPLSIRCKMVLTVMNMPVLRSRATLLRGTTPWGYQYDAITKIDKSNWSGHWIVPGSDQHDAQWVEQTAKQANLVIYYMHGGGYRVGHSLVYTDSFMEITEYLQKTKNMDARIFSIEYSMSPEVQFERTKQDAIDGYRYLVQELGIDPKRIVFMGDSAGGNLVVNCLVDIRDSVDLKQPAGNVQISPWATIENSQTVREGVEYQDCLESKTLEQLDHGIYYPSVGACTHEADKLVALRDAAISPIYGSFVGLCPTLVTYGSTEIFQHDILALIECYKRDKVELEVLTRKAPHIWVICNVLAPNHSVWKEDCSKLADWCAKLM